VVYRRQWIAWEERRHTRRRARSVPSFWDVLTRNLTWYSRVREARERERIVQELQVARQIQRELLPEATPQLDGWEVTTYYEPAREVGGAFYDFLEFEDGRLGLVVGDATGKGMPAALVMATTRGMLRAVVQSLGSPGEVLARVNDALVTDIPPNMFVTCLYAILDPKSGSLRYANAGHDLSYLRHHGCDAEELWLEGYPSASCRTCATKRRRQRSHQATTLCSKAMGWSRPTTPSVRCSALRGLEVWSQSTLRKDHWWTS
jgi:hypothetical protein